MGCEIKIKTGQYQYNYKFEISDYRCFKCKKQKIVVETIKGDKCLGHDYFCSTCDISFNLPVGDPFFQYIADIINKLKETVEE